MIWTIIKAVLLVILVMLASIGAVACVLVFFTIQDDREQADRKSNNSTSE